jgi:hypothetical protein
MKPTGWIGFALVLLLVGLSGPGHAQAFPAHERSAQSGNATGTAGTNVTGNLTMSLDRLVLLAGLAAGAVVTLAWVRVALSWFSTDPTKKITAKDRARDALLGTFILLAAVSGLAWGLAHWVLTGT